MVEGSRKPACRPVVNLGADNEGRAAGSPPEGGSAAPSGRATGAPLAPVDRLSRPGIDLHRDARAALLAGDPGRRADEQRGRPAAGPTGAAGADLDRRVGDGRRRGATLEDADARPTRAAAAATAWAAVTAAAAVAAAADIRQVNRGAVAGVT